MEKIFDFRFGDKESKLMRLEQTIMYFNGKQLKQILDCAKKLEIEGFDTKSAVDVLYEIAGKLSILEAEIISPTSIMEAINKYMESN